MLHTAISLYSRQDPSGVPQPTQYDLSEDNGPHLIEVNSVLFGVAVFFFLARAYVRCVMTRTVGKDDWAMLVSMGGAVMVYVCMIKEIQLGIGRHETHPMITENLNKIAYWSFIRAIFLVWSLYGTKVSVALFLLRVVEGTKYRRYIQGMIIFLVLFTIASIGCVVFQCIPINAAWNFSLKETAKCMSADTFRDLALFNGAINIATDFFFVVLPMPVIWKLNINLQTKLSLIFILSLGFLACAAAIKKEVILGTLLTTPDFSYKNNFAIWNFIELCVGIYAACLPALRPVFGVLFYKTDSTLSSGGQNALKNTQHKYYMQSNDINLTPMQKGNPERYGVSVTTQPRSKLEKTLQDDRSEEYILEDGSPERRCEKGRGIMVQTDVIVH